MLLIRPLMGISMPSLGGTPAVPTNVQQQDGTNVQTQDGTNVQTQ